MAKKKAKAKKKTNKVKKSKKDSESIEINKYHVIGAIAVVAVVLALSMIFHFSRGNFNIFEPSGSVIATVDGNKITSEELDKSYEMFFFVSGYPEEYRSLIDKNTFLDQYINEMLIYEKAKEEGYSVSDEEVKDKINQILQYNGVSESEYTEMLKSAGIDMEDVVSYMKKQIVYVEYLNKTVLKNVSVPEEMIEDYYDSNKELFIVGDEQIRARHILVESEEEAESILKEIRTGGDFEEIAKEKSIGPSAAYGGDLGIFGKGQMVPEFEDAAFDLSVGEISDVVETQFGYHIIKRESGAISLEDASPRIREVLIADINKEAINNFLDSLRAESDIVVSSVEKPSNSPVSGSECYKDYGISADTVIFYHASWCPHCNNMKPIVAELSGEGYSFHSASSDEGIGTEVVEACYQDVLQGGIPQFICAGTKDYEMGEMSKSKLKAFAESCKGN